ncbi:hypothetical protein AAFN60_21330 [Roseibacillus persicicus]|uniref:hypothetical protein n=1 Tax=Roseibacillus persicicus TaxID=454148 RepID=UPI00398B2280
MKISLLLPLLSLSSCCSIVSVVDLDQENSAVVTLMTTETVSVLSELESWTTDKKATLEQGSAQSAKLQLTYADLSLKVSRLSEALQSDFKAGKKKPSAISQQEAQKVGIAIDEFKKANGEASIAAFDWQELLWKIVLPIIEDQIQQARGACEIESLVSLKPYTEL